MNLIQVARYFARQRTDRRICGEIVGAGRLFVSLFLVALIVFYLSACTKTDTNVSGLPDILKIGILPDQNKETLLEQYSPLFQHLSHELDIPYQLIIPASYAELLEQFAAGNIDLAYFGGFTFLQAHEKSRAVPLVMRDIDVHFTSYFIAHTNGSAEKPVNNFSDLKGKKFCFGSKLSTSGHLMPRFYLQKKEIMPETFFSEVVYSGSHDLTTTWVKNGTVDIGVANAAIIDRMIEDGRLNQNDIHIVWETPPYPDYVWAVQSHFGEVAQKKVSQIFLSLSPANKQHAAILAGVDAGGFLPASAEDFEQLHEIAHKAGLLEATPGQH